MRKLTLAVWGLAALAFAWNFFMPLQSDAALCASAPNAHRNGSQFQLASIIIACTNIIESEGQSGMGLSSAFKLRGNAHNSTGQHDLAIRDFDTALKLNPGYTHALIDRGNAYSAAGRLAEAIVDLTRAIEGDPDRLMYLAYFGRALANMRDGQLDAALPDYDEALRRNPNYAPGYFQRGYIYLKKKAFNAAIADFDRALAVDEGFVKAYIYRAVAKCGLGRPAAFVDDMVEISTRNWGVKVKMIERLIKDGHFLTEAHPLDDGAYLAALRSLAEATCKKS